MKILITGGAGFIGSNLAEFIAENHDFSVEKIVIIDNLSLGKKKFLNNLIKKRRINFYREDLLNKERILKIFKRNKFDLVWHLAANSDIGYGGKNTDWDLKQGTIATYNVLECMRLTGVNKIIFASTSAIYGEARKMPTAEDYGPLLPVSFYGASKLASEALITAFSHNYNFQAWIFRFANIVGQNGTHGAIVDFIKKLRINPSRLDVLGNGKQSKPYLHVYDCIDGMVFGLMHAKAPVNIFNLSCDGSTSVKFIAHEVTKKINPTAKIVYGVGKRGWVGDVPKVRLDSKKMEKIGWRAKNSSNQAVTKAIGELLKQI